MALGGGASIEGAQVSKGCPTSPRGVLRLLLPATLLSLLAACAPTVFDVANQNRERLGRLSVGMTRDQVLQVMGTETKEVRVMGPFGRFPVSNPYRTETITTADGVVEVLLYCTDFRGGEFAISEDELTPIVLRDGRVIGWGRTFFEEVQRYEVRVR